MTNVLRMLYISPNIDLKLVGWYDIGFLVIYVIKLVCVIKAFKYCIFIVYYLQF